MKFCARVTLVHQELVWDSPHGLRASKCWALFCTGWVCLSTFWYHCAIYTPPGDQLLSSLDSHHAHCRASGSRREAPRLHSSWTPAARSLEHRGLCMNSSLNAVAKFTNYGLCSQHPPLGIQLGDPTRELSWELCWWSMARKWLSHSVSVMKTSRLLIRGLCASVLH